MELDIPTQNSELVAVELSRYNGENNELVPVELPLYSDENEELVKVELPMYNDESNELVAVEAPPQHNEEMQPSKRSKKSIVWEHFIVKPVGPGSRRAFCMECNQSFAYSTGTKIAGTSHLKRHIAKGACARLLRSQENGQITPLSGSLQMGSYSAPPKRRFHTPQTPYLAFNLDQSRHEIAKMALMHDYPLHMVEHAGFVSFAKSLQPRFDMVSFNTVQGDCVATYLTEKQSLQKVLEAIPGRICLTLDLWSSCRSVGYVFVTGHFIDSDWKMQSKILNVVMEPYPGSDTAFSHAVSACLSDWSLEGKLFSVAINQPVSDASIENLRALLSVKNPLVIKGQLLVGNCLALTLGNVAQEALTSVDRTVKKVRDSVKYVKTSQSNEDMFLELKQQLQVASSKVLALDDQTRWNTTYDMLLAATELKEVFSCLDTTDPDYRGVTSTEDWKAVEILCNYLRPLLDTANILASPGVHTTNIYFHEAWKIQLELARAAASEDSFISSLTKSMQEKFDNYWKSCCFILAIAVVMDPRFKMKLVEFSFQKIYGLEKASEYVKIVDEGIHELFLEYTSSSAHGNNGTVNDNGPELTDFDMYIKQTNSQHSKSELDRYLEESLLPRVHEFDVVGWWRLNKEKYPTLSKMARDILSVPVCTVAPDCVFSSARKEMDRYRSSLQPETVEALICAKAWLQNPKDKDSKDSAIMETPI